MLYSEIKGEVEESEALNSQLSMLYANIMRYGSYATLKETAGNLDISLSKSFDLIESGNTEDEWRVKPNYYLAYYIVSTRIQNPEKHIANTLIALSEAFKKVIEPDEGRNSLRYSDIGCKVLELLLLLINETYDEDFSEWIIQICNDPPTKMDHEFLKSYCAVADELASSSDKIIDSCRQILDCEASSVGSAVMHLLRRYAAKDWNRGEAVFRSLDDEDRFIKNGLLSGLLKNSYEKGWPLAESMFDAPENQAYVMNAMPHLPITTSEIGQRVLDLVLSCDRTFEQNLLNLPSTLARLLNALEFEDSNFVERCYAELNEMAKSENLQTFKRVLEAVWLSAKGNSLQSVQTLKILLLNPIIEHEHIGKLNYHPNFDSVLERVEDAELLFSFFEEYARRFSSGFNHETFYKTLTMQGVRSANPKPFQKKVLECLIHDEGRIRVFGNGILDFFRHYQKDFEFHTDISQLPPISQYKLWMSILLPYKQPKDTVPLLLPLLRSNEPLVAEAFLCKLEEMTECFHEEVIKCVERYARPAGIEESRVQFALTRLKSHYEVFCQQLDRKNSISEFQPSFCQTDIRNRFNEIQKHKMNEMLDAGMHKNVGWLSQIPKVNLAKGGGYKTRERPEIGKLGRFSSSYTMPRFLFIDPEKFEHDSQTDTSADWRSDKTDFVEWITES